MESKIKKEDIVELIAPGEDEQGVKYTVLELRGERCLLEADVPMNIKPQHVFFTNELKQV